MSGGNRIRPLGPSGLVEPLAIAAGAVVSGLAVCAATAVARRHPAIWGGLLAAMPITPTIALLSLGVGEGGTVLAGVSSIVATLLVLGLLIPIAHHRPMLWSGLLAVPLLAILLLHWFPVWFLVTAALVLTLAFLPLSRTVRAGRLDPSPRVSAMSRFLAGFLSVLLVAVVRWFFPFFAPIVALLPILFVTAVLTALADGRGIAAEQVARGGIPGSGGVATFVVVLAVATSLLGPHVALLAAWATYFGTTTHLLVVRARISSMPAAGHVQPNRQPRARRFQFDERITLMPPAPGLAIVGPALCGMHRADRDGYR